MKDRYLAAIDLGSSAIRLAVGQISSGPDKREVIALIGAEEVPSAGISKGSIRSLDDATSAVSSVLDRVERAVGAPVSDVYVGIGGLHCQIRPSKGVIGVSRPDGEIHEEDYRRVLENASTVSNPANFEVLHRLPQRFTVDDQPGVKDPVGMQGVRLEAEVCVIQAMASHVRNLTQAVLRTNVDVTGLVFAPLASAESVLTLRQRELGAALVNIGASTTSIAVFEDGELLHAAVIPIGSDHITSDIAIGLRTSLEVAEQCKRHFASATPEAVSQYDMIDLRELGAPESEHVSPRFISEISSARVEEIFEKVEEELRKINRSGLLPAGVVLAGGGAKLNGIVEIAKRVLRLPASMSPGIQVQTPLLEISRDPAYATVLGLMVWGFEDERNASSARTSNMSGGSGFFKKVGSPIKKIFKSFIP